MCVGHIVVCGLSGSTKFFQVISPTARFSENITEHKVGILSSLQFTSATFLVLRRNERDMIRMFLVFMYNTRYSCQICEKYRIIKLHGNPSRGSQAVPCGRTDGQTRRSKLSLFAMYGKSLIIMKIMSSGGFELRSSQSRG